VAKIVGLRWDKVDLEHRKIRIDSSLLYSPERGIYETSTKTADVRNLTIPVDTVALLKQYRIHQNETRLVNGDRWENTGYVFTRDNGKPINPQSINGWLDGFSNRHGLPHINPHSFRHSVASILIASGTDVVTVSKQLGHASVATTESFYSHIIEENMSKASDCIADVMLRKTAAK
jgi:integrase